ncbi:hypothetical protein GCM10027596_05780 [Nocardioides korecus]
MGYAVFLVIVVVVLVAFAARGRSRSWLTRPSMADYRATVQELGLTEAEQRQVERATRRGEAVPPEHARAGLRYAECLLAAQQSEAAVRSQRWAQVALVVLALFGSFQLQSLISSGFSWTAVRGVVFGLLAAAYAVALPQLRGRALTRLRTAVELDRALLPDESAPDARPHDETTGDLTA